MDVGINAYPGRIRGMRNYKIRTEPIGSDILREDGVPYGGDAIFDDMREITTDRFDFACIRRNGILYVDKTRYAHMLVRSRGRSFCFLSLCFINSFSPVL